MEIIFINSKLISTYQVYLQPYVMCKAVHVLDTNLNQVSFLN